MQLKCFSLSSQPFCVLCFCNLYFWQCQICAHEITIKQNWLLSAAFIVCAGYDASTLTGSYGSFTIGYWMATISCRMTRASAADHDGEGIFLLRNLPSLEGPTRSQSFLTRLSLSTFDKRNELLDISNWLNPLKCAALHNFIFYTVSQFRCTVFVCQD